jgi:hypothetical protein
MYVSDPPLVQKSCKSLRAFPEPRITVGELKIRVVLKFDILLGAMSALFEPSQSVVPVRVFHRERRVWVSTSTYR